LPCEAAGFLLFRRVVAVAFRVRQNFEGICGAFWPNLADLCEHFHQQLVGNQKCALTEEIAKQLFENVYFEFIERILRGILGRARTKRKDVTDRAGPISGYRGARPAVQGGS
ncbi:hypothetical protein, partial [Lactobacillus crispatus]|uniref:hypothetical protein n=1 Tax=Lactobacillus crispatus TaxID=47770 RepID=UPI0010DEDC58